MGNEAIFEYFANIECFGGILTKNKKVGFRTLPKNIICNFVMYNSVFSRSALGHNRLNFQYRLL